MAATRPTVSVVIPTVNGRLDVEACLSSLYETASVTFEIIVVDNGSTDGTVEAVRHRYPDARLILNEANLGHCRAINQGLRAAYGEFVLVLDADTIVWPDALARLVEFGRLRPDVSIVAPRMLNADGSIQETARRFPRPVNALFGRQTLLTRLFPRNRFSRAYLQRAHVADTAPLAVDWVSAACMLFPRTLVGRIGEWDEGFEGYWVDADWCRRAGAIGWIFCLPAARVTHVEQNRSGRKKEARRIVQFHAGAHRFYRKHYTCGLVDPRALAAAVLLAARAALLMAGNRLRLSDTSLPATVQPCRPDQPEALGR